MALSVSDATWLEGRLAHPLDSVTVVANLLDNGIRSAKEGSRVPREVEVTLLSDGDDLRVHVVGSGDGVGAGADHADRVFDHGFTTRTTDVPGHGIGPALVRHTARTHGDDVLMVSSGSAPADPEQHGAAFEARLSGVLTRWNV